MKLLVFILISVCFVNGFHRHANFKKYRSLWQDLTLKYLEHCIEETGVDPLLAVRWLPHGEYVDDYNLKCFIKCAHHREGVGNEDGTVHVQNMLAVMHFDDPAVLDEASIHSCFAIKLQDPCETAFKLSQCIYESIGKANEILYPEPKP